MKSLRLFLSCSAQDLPYAQELSRQLVAAGHRPWPLDDPLVWPSSGFEPDESRRVLLERSDAALILLSPYALKSLRVRQEWQLARARRIPLLLLIIQSVEAQEMLAAMQPCLPGKAPAPDGEMLHWIDVRRRPEEAARKTLAWLEKRAGASHGLPPAPVEAVCFYNEVIPRPARLAAWGQITLAAIGLPIILGALLWLAALQLSAASTFFVDQFFISLLTALSSFALIQLAHIARNGYRTFSRRGKSPSAALTPLRLLALLAALLLLGMGAAANGLGKVALAHGSIFPGMSLLWGLHCLLLVGMLALPEWWERASQPLRMWLPRLERVEAAEQAALEEAAPLPAARPAHASWSNALLRGLRAAFSTGHTQPAYAVAQAGYDGLAALYNRPDYQVSVLAAPQDAPFAESLEKYLKSHGLTVQADVSEIVHAHVNARIQSSSSAPRQAGALVLVVSPWTYKTPSLSKYVHAAQTAGAPILPVLIEDIPLQGAPMLGDFSQERWVDARRNLARARQQVLEAVLQARQAPSTPAPPHPALQARPRSPLATAPEGVQVAQWGLFSSSALKLILLAIFFPMTLWMRPPLNNLQWFSAGLLFLVTYLQLGAVALFFNRRISFWWMALFQADCLGVSLVSLPFLQSDLFWPLGPLSWITLLFPLWEAAVLGWLFAAPEIRQWALSGFWLRLNQLRVSLSTLLYLAAPLFVGLIFLLPVFSVAPAPQLRVSAGRLQQGETALARLAPRARPETWTFKARAGELVTILADGGFNSHQLQFTLAHRAQLLAQSQPTLSGALISGLRLPLDGEYTLHLVDLPSKGLFRLSLWLQRPAQQELTCGAPGNIAVRSGLLRPGQTLAWTLRAEQGDLLRLELHSLTWTLDPWMGLYDASGDPLASNDDHGWRREARLESPYMAQAGPYILLTRGQPGTGGAFVLALSCMR